VNRSERTIPPASTASSGRKQGDLPSGNGESSGNRFLKRCFIQANRLCFRSVSSVRSCDNLPDLVRSPRSRLSFFLPNSYSPTLNP